MMYGRATVSRSAPAGTRYVRVFLYGPGSVGTRSTFMFDGAVLTAE
jgi:hypothetical protein